MTKREFNPSIGGMTRHQQLQAALDTGLCADGIRCGTPPNEGDDPYCDSCPNEFVEPDNVNSPQHYQSENGIECIEAIRAQLTSDQFTAYCQGNISKYLWRWRSKGGVESLRKAKWYLDRMIAEVVDDATT